MRRTATRTEARIGAAAGAQEQRPQERTGAKRGWRQEGKAINLSKQAGQEKRLESQLSQEAAPS
jgi:hypothetical protein